MMGIILPPEAKRLCHPELEMSSVPGKNRTHYRDSFYESQLLFGARLIDLYMITPDLTVIDGITGGEGTAFIRPGADDTVPVASRRAFASTNLVNVDTIAGWFMGYDPRDPQVAGYPEQAMLWPNYFGEIRGFGYMNPEKIRILGDRQLIEPVHRYQHRVLYTFI